MLFSDSLNYEKRRVIIGIAFLILKLPRDPIVDVTDISESELWSIYFDPLLSAIISDNERNTRLQWLNKHAEDNRLTRRINHIDRPVTVWCPSWVWQSENYPADM